MGEESKNPSADLSRQQFHQDANTANDLSRNAAQIMILINGGAATAVIAYASNAGKGAAPQLFPLTFVAISLCIFAIGVLAGAVMMICLAMCIDSYMQYWLKRTENRSRSSISRSLKDGQWWWRIALGCFAVSAACFIISCWVLAFGWWWTF